MFIEHHRIRIQIGATNLVLTDEFGLTNDSKRATRRESKRAALIKKALIKALPAPLMEAPRSMAPQSSLCSLYKFSDHAESRADHSNGPKRITRTRADHWRI